MPETPHLIAAAPEHSDILADLHGTAFPEAPWQAGWFRDQLTRPAIKGWRGLIGDSPAGLLVISTIGPEAEILTLGTRPRFRRQGVAAALLGDALYLPVKSLFLEVSTANTAAIALYAAHGFTETGRRNGYYRDGSDAILMARPIYPPEGTGV